MTRGKNKTNKAEPTKLQQTLYLFSSMSPEEKNQFLEDCGIEIPEATIEATDEEPQELTDAKEKVINEVKVFHHKRRSSVENIIKALHELEEIEEEFDIADADDAETKAN